MIRAVAVLLALLLFLQVRELPAQTAINVKVKDAALASFFRAHSGELNTEQQAALRTAYTWTKTLKQVQPLRSLPDGGSAHPLENVFTLGFDQGSGPALAQQLHATGLFEFAEETRSFRTDAAPAPSAAELDSQWHHAYIHTQQAWAITKGSSSIVTGVIDTGIDYGHPEFAGQLTINTSEDLNGNDTFEPWPDTVMVAGITGDFNGLDEDGNGYADDVIGYDFTDQPRSPFGGDYLFPDADPADENAHGTLVAAIIGAKENNYGGAGVAPGCRLMTLRAFSADGSGEDDDISRAIVYAADNGVHILNFSFGDIYPSRMMHEAIRYAESRGVVMVASAGNGTGDEIHYPSNFNEVISVSASALSADSTREIPWLLSSYGTAVSLAAPGSGIYTAIPRDTSGDPPFDYFSGTSCSAPMVTGAVALLFSQRGVCTGQQVRGILTTSADDISDEGWDHFTGAGRLNIEAALNTIGAPHVQITSPENDFGTAANSVTVSGTVLDPEFRNYSLEYQSGTFGLDTWIPIVTGVDTQVKAGILGVWNTTSLVAGEYTLRLRVDRSDGSTCEDRVRFIRDLTAPVVQVKYAGPIWDNNERKLLIDYRCDDAASVRLQYRPVASAAWKSLAFDRFTRNGYFLLGPDEISPGQYVWQLEARNAAGLVSVFAPDTADFTPDFISMNGFDTTGVSVPFGHYLDKATDFDGDGLKEVVVSYSGPMLSFGPLEIHEYNGGFFSQMDSSGLNKVLIPKDAADTDGDGNMELLCSVNDSIYLLEQPAPGANPTSLTYTNFGNGLYAARFANADNDPQDELLTKDFKDYYRFEGAGSMWNQSATLPDITPDYTGSIAPRVLTADFDGDGNTEVIFGDYDGDFLVYEFNGSGYTAVYQDTSALEKAGAYLAQGDFDGDGAEEFFVATQSSQLRNNDFEYDTPLIRLRIFKATADNTYTVVWEDYLFDIDTDSYNSSLAENLDGDSNDEILFATYPRVYLIEYTGGTYKPVWFEYGTISMGLMAADFNGNGVNEFPLGYGETAKLYEKDFTYTGPAVPASLNGVVLSSSSVSLNWPAAPGAAEYRIWRGDVPASGPIFISLMDSTASLTYTDTGLTTMNDYLYVVQSKNNLLTPTLSDFSFAIVLRPHPRCRLDSAVAVNAFTVAAHFSQPVTDRSGDPAHFTLDGSITPASVTGGGEPTHRLLLSFEDSLTAGAHTLSVDSLWLDAWRGFIDPSADFAIFDYTPDTSAPVYLTKWEIVSGKEAKLYYNTAMTSTAVDAANYALEPSGSVTSVRFADAAQRSVIVTLNEPVLGALGNPISIIVTGAVSQNGDTISDKEGNVATFSAYANDLSAVYVYPNPFRQHAQFSGIRFANLTKEATVTVITAAGRKVITLNESGGDGGIEWNLMDESGQRILPGVYIYKVTAPEQEEFLGKFSILE